MPGLLARAQMQSGEQVSSFEFISRQSLDLLLTSHPDLHHPLPGEAEHYVLLEVATASPVLSLEDAMTALLEELMEAQKTEEENKSAANTTLISSDILKNIQATRNDEQTSGLADTGFLEQMLSLSNKNSEEKQDEVKD